MSCKPKCQLNLGLMAALTGATSDPCISVSCFTQTDQLVKNCTRKKKESTQE